MLKAWFLFFFISFAISVLALTFVQTRARKRLGSWSALRARSPFDTYWHDLSPTLRLLVWVGTAAFGITLIIGSVASLVAK